MDLYSFVYRGMLTDASLDRAGRQTRRELGEYEADRLAKTLSFDRLDPDLLAGAQLMAVVYTAIHAFENMLREFVKKAMQESCGENWWSEVPKGVRDKVKTRMEADAKFRFHSSRGASEIFYADFGHLAAIINKNWPIFEPVVVDLEWAKTILGTLEMSRNAVMHGGELAKEDIERVGLNIRDWIRQTG